MVMAVVLISFLSCTISLQAAAGRLGIPFLGEIPTGDLDLRRASWTKERLREELQARGRMAWAEEEFVRREQIRLAEENERMHARLREELGCPSSLFLELAREGWALLGPALGRTFLESGPAQGFRPVLSAHSRVATISACE